jgi:hypothetical protein
MQNQMDTNATEANATEATVTQADVTPVSEYKHSHEHDHRRQWERLRFKYPSLFPLLQLSSEHRKVLHEQLKGIDVCHGGILCNPCDLKNWVFLILLARLQGVLAQEGQSPANPIFVCRSVCQLVEDYFVKGEEREDLPDLNRAHVVALWLGYGELSHRYNQELPVQRMELTAAQGPLRRQTSPALPSLEGQTFWLFWKGTASQLLKRYPEVVETARALNYPILDLFRGVSPGQPPIPSALSAADEIDEL